ncbi:hypothetical protein K435DRAFT_860874 [Dendrothele bispora CBS 962.96]|uniref:Uncharacterized protein n=1 Tax=Dendrothele bispora (strain CBS 962.96) TaxID=1314807 RepID=A0A4S8LWV4_DENBC|nr:hypothetical protein K435DRAFT_860874 [Dendrothele bispora CBS 962.96]
MSGAVTIIVDDADLFEGGLVQPGSARWGTLPTFNTTLVIDDTLQNKIPFTFPIKGITSLALVGFTPTPSNDQTFSVQIGTDGQDADIGYWSNISYPSPNLGCQFFTTPDLPGNDTNHPTFFFNLTASGGVSFDYAIMQVGNFRDITGKTIIVDDSSPEISWQGNWQEENSSNLNLTIPFKDDQPYNVKSWYPHGNSTHRSNQVGDSFTFQFAGTSIVVAGIFPVPNEQPDAFVAYMNFTIDDYSVQRKFIQQDVQTQSQVHFPWFKNNTLAPGAHTLVVEVLSLGGLNNDLMVEIDYLTYTPSFRTASEKPNFGTNPTNSSGSDPAPTENPPPSDSNNTQGANIGGIIGGLVAGIFILLVGSIGGYLFWRHKKELQQRLLHQTPTPFRDTSRPPTGRFLSEKGRILSSPSSILPVAHLVPTPNQDENLESAQIVQQGTNSRVGSQSSQQVDNSHAGGVYATRDEIQDVNTRIDMLRRQFEPPAYQTVI